MTCPMCPAWMGGSMAVWGVVGLLVVALLVVVIIKLLQRP